MGRHRESVEMLEFKGKSHKTKAELKERTENKFSLGNTDFKEPEYVACDPVAHEKWVWLINLYSSSEQFGGHITTAQTDQMATYCVLYSNQLSIIENLQTANGKTRAALSNSLLKVSVEINKLGKCLLLDYFSIAKVTPVKVEVIDELAAAGFGNI